MSPRKIYISSCSIYSINAASEAKFFHKKKIIKFLRKINKIHLKTSKLFAFAKSYCSKTLKFYPQLRAAKFTLLHNTSYLNFTTIIALWWLCLTVLYSTFFDGEKICFPFTTRREFLCYNYIKTCLITRFSTRYKFLGLVIHIYIYGGWAHEIKILRGEQKLDEKKRANVKFIMKSFSHILRSFKCNASDVVKISVISFWFLYRILMFAHYVIIFK